MNEAKIEVQSLGRNSEFWFIDVLNFEDRGKLARIKCMDGIVLCWYHITFSWYGSGRTSLTNGTMVTLSLNSKQILADSKNVPPQRTPDTNAATSNQNATNRPKNDGKRQPRPAFYSHQILAVKIKSEHSTDWITYKSRIGLHINHGMDQQQQMHHQITSFP